MKTPTRPLARFPPACAALLALALTQPLRAQDAQAPAHAAGDLAKASQNPVSDLISLPFQNNFLFSEDGGDLTWNLNIQPVIPVSLNDDWNLVTRTILPVLGLEKAPPGFDSFGIGDLNTTLFLSPAASSKFVWGFGPILSFPTATDDVFGTGKWGAGPSAVALVMTGPWVAGGLVNNVWSYAGDGGRPDVNAMLIQPFINYNFDRGWFASFAPIMTADWNADGDDRWTIPLGGGFGRVFSIGKQPVNATLQAYYNVERPDGGPEWSIRAQVQLLFPK